METEARKMKRQSLSEQLKIRTMEQGDIPALLPPRDAYAHKGDFGKVLLLCGAVGYTGAAAMASQAALRCGSGLAPK